MSSENPKHEYPGVAEAFEDLVDLTGRTRLFDEAEGYRDLDDNLNPKVYVDGCQVWSFMPAGDTEELVVALARAFRFQRRAFLDAAREQGPHMQELSLEGRPGLLCYYQRREQELLDASAESTANGIEVQQELQAAVKKLIRKRGLDLRGSGLAYPGGPPQGYGGPGGLAG